MISLHSHLKRLTNLVVKIRSARLNDLQELYSLYRTVAAVPGGLARSPSEVTLATVRKILVESLRRGVILVLEQEGIIGCVHATRSSIRDLSHVMGDLTILISPAYQRKGLGFKLFEEFQRRISGSHPEVLRVELRARASNLHALHLYESIGFRREGLFKKRIRNPSGELDDGIPMVWLNPNFEELR